VGQVAFRGFFLGRIPDRPVGSLRAGVDASLAANAFLFVDPSDVAVGGIHVTRARGAILDTQRGDALPAYRHDDIVGVFGEGRGIANDLDSGH
jgi:hypothetical protein